MLVKRLPLLIPLTACLLLPFPTLADHANLELDLPADKVDARNPSVTPSVSDEVQSGPATLPQLVGKKRKRFIDIQSRESTLTSDSYERMEIEQKKATDPNYDEQYMLHKSLNLGK